MSPLTINLVIGLDLTEIKEAITDLCLIRKVLELDASCEHTDGDKADPINTNFANGWQDTALTSFPSINTGTDADGNEDDEVPKSVNGVELDADGLPWDARIDTKSKALLKKDGTWRKIKNIDPDLVSSVQQELRELMDIPAPQVTLAQEAVVPSVPTAPIPIAPPPVYATEAPAPAPAPTAKELALRLQSTLENTQMTMGTFMAHVTKATVDGPMTTQQVNDACAAVGVANISVLQARPDLISAVYNILFPS